MLCSLYCTSLPRYWLSLQRIASFLRPLISGMQHEVTSASPSAPPATREGIHPCKLQQVLELCHLYCKTLSLLVCKIWRIAAGREEAWSPSTLESYLGLDIWSGLQMFICSPTGIRYKDLQGTKASSPEDQVYNLFYSFVSSGRNYTLWFIPGWFPVLMLSASLWGEILSTHRLLLFTWKKNPSARTAVVS